MSANSDYYWDIVFGGLLANFLLRRSEFISANSDYFWESVFGGLLAKLPQENFKYQQIQIFWDSVFGGLLAKLPQEENIKYQQIQIFFGTVCLVVFWQSFRRRRAFMSANSDYFWDSVFGGLLAKFS